MRNMPARPPPTGKAIKAKLAALGQSIRARRKALRVNATTAAEAAGLSRVTLHRIERGEPAVTMGAWMSVTAAIGLELEIFDPSHRREGALKTARRLPAAIPVADYPQLRRLAWQMKDDAQLSPKEALELYERNWRHIDREAMSPQERNLVRRLAEALGGGRLLV